MKHVMNLSVEKSVRTFFIFFRGDVKVHGWLDHKFIGTTRALPYAQGLPIIFQSNRYLSTNFLVGGLESRII